MAGMKRVVSNKELQAKLSELLEAAASGETIEVETGCGRVTLSASGEFDKMAEKAESHDRRMAIFWERYEEARTMVFEVDPEEEAELQEAVDIVKEIRREISEEARRAAS